jgi:hypothetical protein
MYNLDETWVSLSTPTIHLAKHGKTKSSDELKVEPEKGSRITLCHA